MNTLSLKKQMKKLFANISGAAHKIYESAISYNKFNMVFPFGDMVLYNMYCNSWI